MKSPGQNGSRERGFGTLKYERLYIDEIDDAVMLAKHAEEYRIEYNEVRPHEALAWNRPKEVHLALASPTVPTFQATETCQLLDAGHAHKEAAHGMLEVALDPATVVDTVDPGKVMNRVWISNGTGLLEEPVSLPVARSGIAALEKMLAAHAGEQVIAIEATGSLHPAWATELERRHPARCACSRPRKRKRRARSWGLGGAMPMTATARR